ncbi:helix-turn-helix transcriptional regulator [Terrirubrum flagellatum]|uniref:helix-turn-helix transcriptional regulator n=1 Tax=Terrirubrum flagellatum TaxID=2895980 RepID=UPI003CC824E3
MFLTIADLCERWSFIVKPQTLAKWRAARRGPAYKKIGGRILYALADVEKYERAQQKDATQLHPANCRTRGAA